jgi:hypothetical protein
MHLYPANLEKKEKEAGAAAAENKEDAVEKEDGGGEDPKKKKGGSDRISGQNPHVHHHTTRSCMVVWVCAHMVSLNSFLFSSINYFITLYGHCS